MGGDAEIREFAAGKADDRNHSPGVNKVGNPRTNPDSLRADYDL